MTDKKEKLLKIEILIQQGENSRTQNLELRKDPELNFVEVIGYLELVKRQVIEMANREKPSPPNKTPV